jgi:hypothetical protein
MGGLRQDPKQTSLPAADRIIVLAGLRYREFLMDYLRGWFRRVCEGMRSLHPRNLASASDNPPLSRSH